MKHSYCSTKISHLHKLCTMAMAHEQQFKLFDFKLTIWIRTKWDNSVFVPLPPFIAELSLSSILGLVCVCLCKCGWMICSRLKPRFSTVHSWVYAWELCSLESAFIPCRPFSPNLATWTRKSSTHRKQRQKLKRRKKSQWLGKLGWRRQSWAALG